MCLSCYDILPVQCFHSFGTDCVFCLSNKCAAVQFSVNNHWGCQVLPTHLRWVCFKNKIMCLAGWHIRLLIRHIKTISSTQPLAPNQLDEDHLLLSQVFIRGRSSSVVHRWHISAIEKCLGEVETWRKLLPKLHSVQQSHLLWHLSGWWLKINIQEPQRCPALVKSQVRPEEMGSKLSYPTAAGKNQQIQTSSASYLPPYEKGCIYVVWNAAVLVQGLKTKSPQEGQFHGAGDQGLSLTPLQLSCDTSSKSLAPTLAYPFINMLDRHVKKCHFLSWITYLVLTIEDLFLRKFCLD